jgi:hypothetical protein
MRAYHRLGEPGEALAAYERLRALLAEELGADPAPETERVHLAVLRGGAVEDEAPTPAPARAGESGLVGRDRELAVLWRRPNPVPGVYGLDYFAAIQRRWELFADDAPEDVAAAVLGLLDDPGPLVAELSRAEATLNHGDLKYANLGLTADRVILLDWGTFTGMAPPAVDFA